MITNERYLNKFDQTLLLSEWKKELSDVEFEFVKASGLLKEVPLSDLVGFKCFFSMEQTFSEYEIVRYNESFFLQSSDLSDEPVHIDKNEVKFAKLDWNLFLLRLKDSNSLSLINEAFKKERSIDYVGSRLVNNKTIHVFSKNSLIATDIEKVGSFISLNRKNNEFFVFITSGSDLYFSNQVKEAFKGVASFGGINHVNAQFKISPQLIYDLEFQFSFHDIVNSCGSDVLIADKSSLQVFLGDKKIATGSTDSVLALIHLMENTNRDCSINEITYDVLKKTSLTDASKTVRDFKYNLIKKIEAEHGKNSSVAEQMIAVISNSGPSNYGKVRLNVNNVGILVINDKSVSTHKNK